MLFIDLYEITMLRYYLHYGMVMRSAFEFFVRRKDVRNYYVFWGIEEFLKLDFSFKDDEIKYLSQFLDYETEKFLRNFDLVGEIYSLEEGEIFFPYEPVLTFISDLPTAQILETIVLNFFGLRILVASKAARCYSVARGKTLVDFGARRAQGETAGIVAAVSSYVAGFSGTSLISAGYRYGIPLYGTMAHSLIMADSSELEAFKKFLKLYPNSILLVDTYDTVEGIKNAIRAMKETGIPFAGIRIDSGRDLRQISIQAREILRSEGLGEKKIFLSGGLNEFRILELADVADGFGVGSELVVSSDIPYLDSAYKLVEYGGVPKVKLSFGKETRGGIKKIYRFMKNGKMIFDVVANILEDEKNILEFAKTRGKFDDFKLITRKYRREEVLCKGESEIVKTARENFFKNFELLPDELKSLKEYQYPVYYM